MEYERIRMKRMKFVFAPDSFKGSLTAQEMCAFLAEEAQRAFPGCETVSLPVADGGEGTADALATALCNRLQGPGDVKAVVDYARRFVKHGLTGIFAQCGGAVGVWGDMELTAVERNA